MAPNVRDTRLSEASTLQEAMESLQPLDPAKRQAFVHDRLMSAIDDICEKHKGRQGGAAFTASQMLVIRDIAHHIVYILDPLNKTKRGFVNDLKSNWKESTAFDKVKVAAAVGVFVYGLVVGSYNLITAGLSSWRSSSASGSSTISKPDQQKEPLPTQDKGRR